GESVSGRPGVAIIGCGVIGERRFRALGAARLVATADTDSSRAAALAARQEGAVSFTDWRDAVAHPGVDIVIVATLHDSLAEITAGAIAAGRNVLVEKPGGRHPGEIAPLIAAAAGAGVLVRVGFNHRFHPAVRKARSLVDE